MRIGYTLMTEQSPPKDIVRYATYADESGFDFAVMSDHYFPWLQEQGHAGYAWAMLGAVAQATERLELMTYVTCPIMRYHPAVVAQKAATIQILSDGRFTLGLGSGENLNEHVVGRDWPPVNVRHEMLAEAIDVINALFDGGYVDYAGAHFRVDSAKLWDLPDRRVEIGTAVSGDQSVQLFAPVSDHLIAVEPKPELVQKWHRAGPRGDRAIGQMPVCWGPSREQAAHTAHEQFRWFGGGWKVNAELPGPAGFAGATQFVRPEDVAGAIPCGPDPEPIVQAAKEYADAGFTDLALVQIGNDRQEEFVRWAEKELVPTLRGL